VVDGGEPGVDSKDEGKHTTKLEDPTPVRCSVMTCNISRWKSFKMLMLPLRLVT